MEKEEASYDIGVIRQLILEAFTAKTLRSFCQDRKPLRPIVQRFGPGYGLDDMVAEVIDHCRKHLLLDLLLAEIEKVNPRQYERFKGRLRISPEALAEVPCPYRGLEPFEVQHAENYFGRQPMIKRLIAGVHQHPFVAVVGPSGCGKSSLVRAGLVTALHFGLLPNSRAWTVLVFRPGVDPVYTLCRQWITLLQPETTGVTQQVEAARQAAALIDGSLSTRNIVADLRNTRPDIPHVVLIVDQFEELYTECRDQDRQQAFIQALLMAAEEQGVSVVLTLRADFYGHVLAHRRLGQAVDACAINVLPMSEAELREAIEKPVHRVARSFESGLVDRILEDVAGEPGNLPLLEFALLKLWEKQTVGGLLTHQAYEEIGRVKGAIAQHAEEIYGQMVGEHRAETVQRIFLRLIHYGDGAGETRRQALLTELITPRTPQEEVEPVVQALARARLLVTGWAEPPLDGGEAPPTAGPATGSSEASRTATVEVAHEALIQSWERLHDWLAEDRAFGLWREKAAQARQTWEETQHDQDALLRGTTLSEAEGWLAQRGDDLNEAERAFIEQGLAQRKREEKEREVQQRREAQLAAERRTAGRLRSLAVGLAVSVMIAAVLAGFALVLRGRAIQERDARATEVVVRSTAEAVAVAAQAGAETEARARATAQVEAEVLRDRAEAARAESDVLKLAFASLSQLKQDHELALLLAIEARRLGASLETDTALWSWLADPGRAVKIFTGDESDVRHVAWSPDARRIAVAGCDQRDADFRCVDGRVRVWDVETGELLTTLSGHTAEVQHVAWSPDGRRTATASLDGTARVWDAAPAQDSGGFGEELVVFRAHSDRVQDVAWDPDGRRIVTASSDGTARVWDAGTGAELAILSGHTDVVRRAVWDKDGQRIATASDDGTARVWGAETGASLASLDGHENAVMDVVWSPDGGRIATASFDGTARVWDAETGAALLVFRGHQAELWRAAWGKDGEHIVTASYDGTARVWDAESGLQVAILAGHLASVRQAAWSPDGRRIITAGGDNTVRLWDAETGVELDVLTGHEAAVTQAEWSPDGGRIVTASDDGTVRVWDAGGRTELIVLRGHKAGVTHAAWSPDDRQIVTTGEDSEAKVWDATNGAELVTLIGHWGPVMQAAWDKEGQRIVTTSVDDTARVWDAETGMELTVLTGHEAGIRHAAWSPDGQHIVTAGCNQQDEVGICIEGVARVWDAETGAEVTVLAGPDADVWHAAWSPDGQRIVTAGCKQWDRVGACVEGTVRVWAVEGGEELAVLPVYQTEVLYAAWSPDGERIVATSGDGTARVWDVPPALRAGGTSTEPTILTGHEAEVEYAAWDKGGQRIVTASYDGTARVWDAETGAELANLDGHTGKVEYAAWSPAGRRIVTASHDGTARVWDAETGAELVILAGHKAEVLHAAWDGSGQRVVTASFDGTARIYYVGFEDLVAFACQQADRNLSQAEWQQYLGDQPYRETCPGKPPPPD